MRYVAYLIALALFAATGCGGGGSTSTTSYQAPPPPPPTVTVYPAKAITPVGTFQPFTATEIGSAAPLKWTASAGTIDQAGNYTAPLAVPAGGTAKVTASTTTKPVVSGSATVTITTQPVTLSITPLTATVKAGFSQAYAGVVGGTTNIGVTWSVTGSPGDTTFPGFITSGLYTAPSPIFAPDTFLILATSNADPTKTASATVSVVPLENQLEQTFPIKLGTSGINAKVSDCCTGTLGSLLVDQKGKQYILSNNHVLGRLGHASPGEAIIQPGYVDTLCDRTMPHTVANLTYVPPINTGLVDAAIAQVVAGAVDPKGEIIGLGGVASDGSYIPAAPANSIATATVGMPVAKSGRTTGLSCSSVIAVAARVCIEYGPDCGNPSTYNVCFSGQVITGGSSFARPGDSGSLILDADTAQPLAMVVGGNGQFTSANPVGDILNALKTGTGSTFRFVGAGQHRINCAPPGAVSREELMGTSPAVPNEEIAHAIEVQKRNESVIMRDPAVLAIGIGRDENSGHPAVLVFLDQAKLHIPLPAALEGVPVRLIKTGRFRAINSRAPNRETTACKRVPAGF